MTRPLSFSVCAALCFLGAGCAASPVSPPPSTTPPTQTGTPSAQTPPALGSGLELRITTTTKELTLDQNAGCRFLLELPQFTGTDADARVGTMNRAIHEELLFDRSSDATTTPRILHPDEIQASFLEECQRFMQDELKDNPDAGAYKREWMEESTVLARQLPHGLVSLDLNTYAFTGGAHPNGWSRHLNFDTNTRTILTLNELIRPERREALSQAIAKAVLAEARDRLYDDAVPAFEALAENASSSGAIAFVEEIQKQRNWSLDATGFVFSWNAYDLGPYSSGPIDVTLPYKNHADLIAPAWLERLTTLE